MSKLKPKVGRKELLERAGRLWPHNRVGDIMWLALKEAVDSAEIARLSEGRRQLQARIKEIHAERRFYDSLRPRRGTGIGYPPASSASADSLVLPGSRPSRRFPQPIAPTEPA